MICDPLQAPNTINHTHSRSRLAAGSPPGRQAFGDLTFPEVAPESAAARNLLFRTIKRHEAPVVE